MPNKEQPTGDAARLRRLAEEQLQRRHPDEAEAPRLLHELQVHQIELEMQNAELNQARNRLEVLLEKYTDLYDFAPVGYFTLDISGQILETNLTGAGLLGLERSLVIGKQFGSFVVPALKAAYRSFLQGLFEGSIRSNCEVELNKPDGTTICVDLQGNEAHPDKQKVRFCRLVASDITPIKRAEEAQDRVEALYRANQELQMEIERRKVVEQDLRESEQQQAGLLKQARHLQKQLRQVSHLILNSQEEERRRISLELHDEIAQTLVGINVHLSALAKDPSIEDSDAFDKVVTAQKLVEDSVRDVHQFAMKLRPPILDDLGLVVALKSYISDFTSQTNIPVDFYCDSDLEKLSEDRSTILYRVAQEALTNVARHAQASQVEVQIKVADNTISMEIHDNGKSFEVEKELLASKVERIGVIGMRERMDMGGGSFHIDSSPGKGTTVSVAMPIKKLPFKAKVTS